MQDVLRLRADEVAEAAEVVVRAFERDPLFRHFFPGTDRRYLRQLRAAFRMLFGANLQRGQPLFGIRVQGTLVGAVALEKPGRPMSWGDCLRSPLLLRQLVGFGLSPVPGEWREWTAGTGVCAPCDRPSRTSTCSAWGYCPSSRAKAMAERSCNVCTRKPRRMAKL